MTCITHGISVPKKKMFILHYISYASYFLIEINISACSNMLISCQDLIEQETYHKEKSVHFDNSAFRCIVLSRVKREVFFILIEQSCFFLLKQIHCTYYTKMYLLFQSRRILESYTKFFTNYMTVPDNDYLP
jgi:hypothetical protein